MAFVEDTAVAPAVLGAYPRRFRQDRRAPRAVRACYGHADVGCLHIRPIINCQDRGRGRTLRAIAREVSDLVVEFGGAMSGEHGDGLARSLWNREAVRPRGVRGVRGEVKRAFDPDNRMNPGKVVAAPR